MGAFHGYFDDSGDEPDPRCNNVSYAGFVGSIEQWRELEGGWLAILRDNAIPYLHMKELMGIDYRPVDKPSPYDKWRGKPDEIECFLLSLAECVQKSGLCGIAAAVDKAALSRLCEKHGINGKAAIGVEELAIYCCLWLVQSTFGEHTILELLIDKTCKPERLRHRIAEIGSHETRDVPFMDHITFSFLAKDDASRHLTDESKNIYALQAADFIAWETHNFVRARINGGFDFADAKRRQSYASLSDNSEKYRTMFVDDLTLTSWDEQKNGAWPNTQRGRMTKTWNEFWDDVKERGYI